MSSTILIPLILVVVAFCAYAWRFVDDMGRVRSGRILLLGGFLVMPLIILAGGSARVVRDSGSREFCLSCHEMTPYQASLEIDDNEYLPAVHYQNHLVDPERACYECHTDYTLYGDLDAKLNGLKHVWIHYLGDIPEPGEMALYSPYPNANCLKCHKGARRFEEHKQHRGGKAGLDALYANEKSCLQQGCHDLGHGIRELDTLDRWRPSAGAKPEAAPAGSVDDLFGDEETKTPPDAAPGATLDEELDDLFGDEETKAPPDAAPRSTLDDELDDLFDDDPPADSGGAPP